MKPSFLAGGLFVLALALPCQAQLPDPSSLPGLPEVKPEANGRNPRNVTLPECPAPTPMIVMDEPVLVGIPVTPPEYPRVWAEFDYLLLVAEAEQTPAAGDLDPPARRPGGDADGGRPRRPQRLRAVRQRGLPQGPAVGRPRDRRLRAGHRGHKGDRGERLLPAAAPRSFRRQLRRQRQPGAGPVVPPGLSRCRRRPPASSPAHSAARCGRASSASATARRCGAAS